MDSTHTTPLLMPVLKLSCSEIISYAKIKILKAIDRAGGMGTSWNRYLAMENHF
jgi:hypothetical protein